MNGITVQQWKDMFTEIGLTEADMHAWHRLFEKRHPKAHQRFLEWLGVDVENIGKIRRNHA